MQKITHESFRLQHKAAITTEAGQLADRIVHEIVVGRNGYKSGKYRHLPYHISINDIAHGVYHPPFDEDFLENLILRVGDEEVEEIEKLVALEAALSVILSAINSTRESKEAKTYKKYRKWDLEEDSSV